jgi:hypothetical protein
LAGKNKEFYFAKTLSKTKKVMSKLINCKSVYPICVDFNKNIVYGRPNRFVLGIELSRLHKPTDMSNIALRGFKGAPPL